MVVCGNPENKVIRQLLQGFCGAAIAVACAVGVLQPAVTATRQGAPGQLAARAVSQVPTLGITWDFETGNLAGWRIVGDAFVNQPTLGDNTSYLYCRGIGRTNLVMTGKWSLGY